MPEEIRDAETFLVSARKFVDYVKNNLFKRKEVGSFLLLLEEK